VEVGVEDDLRAAPNGPSDGLGVPPSFVADGHSERQIADGEHATIGTWFVEIVFRRIDLHFVLETGDAAVAIDDERGRDGRVVYHALGSKDDAACFAPASATASSAMRTDASGVAG
jgi:hypothetical protein